ncbi:MAG: hypothetical protein AABY22_02340 [Nanoarchaeota archaeon]
MECDIIYVETKVRQLDDRKNEIVKGFFIVTKKGFIPIRVFQSRAVDSLGTESMIRDCYIDFKGNIVIDKEVKNETHT